jgi:hypothetical protein
MVNDGDAKLPNNVLSRAQHDNSDTHPLAKQQTTRKLELETTLLILSTMTITHLLLQFGVHKGRQPCSSCTINTFFLG